jgi:hypothetical protein
MSADEGLAEQVFEETPTDELSSEGIADSWDEFIDGDIDDTDSEESNEETESSDSEVLASESEKAEPEVGSEDRQDSSELESVDNENGKEAGIEGEADQVEEKADEAKELDLATEVEVKIDGEMTSVSIEELKSNYSGKVAYDKKFSELDQERTIYKSEVKEVEGYINKFGEIAQTGDILGALQYFSEFTSIPPHELKAQLLNQLVPEVDRLRGLSEEEVNLEYQTNQNDYLKQQNETEHQKLVDQQSSMALETEVRSLQQTHDIQPSEWDSAVNTLNDHLNADQELTPELVANYVQTDRAYIQAEGLLDSVDVSLKSDNDVLDEMQRIITRNPDFSDEDLTDIIKNAFGTEQNKEESTLIKKVEQSQPKKLNKQKKSDFSPITLDGEEVDDFEDLF